MKFDNLKVEKRGDRFYFIDEYGDELEVTAEQAEANLKAADFMGKHLNAMSDMAKVNKWRVSDVPKDVDSYASIKAFFDIQKEQFKKLYNEVDDKELLVKSLIKTCDLAKSKLESDSANPYLKSEQTNYQIKGWEDLRSFIAFFTLGNKQQKFKPNPALINMLSETSAPLKQEQAQFEGDLKECRLSLEEIHDKALDAAQKQMDIFESKLNFELETYPHRKDELLNTVKDKLGEDYKRYRFKSSDTKDTLLAFLQESYGTSRDGVEVYKYLSKGYYVKLRREYLSYENLQPTTQVQPEKVDEGNSIHTLSKSKIEDLKAAAIAETIELFKGKYEYEPEYQVLLDELNRNFDDYGIKHEIYRNLSFIKTGRIKELEKEIHGFLDTCQKGKGKIITNEGNVVSNSKPPRMALDYCKYAFWELFHSNQLQNIKQLSIQSEAKNGLQKVDFAERLAGFEDEEWIKFEGLKDEIAKIRAYTTEKKDRIADRNITLSELEYEEADINSYVTQVIQAYPSKGMLFKYVPSLNEKYRRLLAESIAGLESLIKVTKARIHAKKMQLVAEHTNQAQLPKGKKSINDNSISFEDYLTEKRLHPLLQKEYTNAEPKKIVPMLLALEEGVWIINGYKSNVTGLHRALEYSFGKIGSRQAYADAFNKFNQVNTATEELKIKAEQKLISAMLDKLKENESTKDTC